MSCIFLLCFISCFLFSSNDNTLLRVLSELWPLNKAHLKYLPCPRNPFKFFHHYTIIFLITPCVHAKLVQSCWTLCNPMHCSLPGSSVRGILQAETLEWGAVPSSRESSWPRDWTRISYVYLQRQVDSLPLAPPGKSNTSLEDSYFHLSFQVYPIISEL